MEINQRKHKEQEIGYLVPNNLLIHKLERHHAVQVAVHVLHPDTEQAVNDGAMSAVKQKMEEMEQSHDTNQQRQLIAEHTNSMANIITLRLPISTVAHKSTPFLETIRQNDSEQQIISLLLYRETATKLDIL